MIEEASGEPRGADRHPIRLCDHPRGSRQVELARGWAGIGAMALVALLSHRAGVPAFEAGARGLLCGVAAYVVVWGLAVMVWRHLALAEAKAARAAAEARRGALLEEIERRSRQASTGG